MTAKETCNKCLFLAEKACREAARGGEKDGQFYCPFFVDNDNVSDKDRQGFRDLMRQRIVWRKN